MKALIYYGDPMCSWCWGFAPQIAMIGDWFKGRLPVRMVMGGLRPGTTEPMSIEMKVEILGHWKDVAAKTGQAFDYTFLERSGFVYDTEPACRAVVVARELGADKALPAFNAIQQAFYERAWDVTSRDVLGEIVEGVGVNRATFDAIFDTEGAREATERDFLASRNMRVTGFPTLIAEEDGKPPKLLTAGYRKLDSLVPALEKWLGS